MAPLIAALVKMGLPLIAGAVQEKGKEFIEEKLGIELKPEMTAEEIQVAADKQREHERFLVDAAQKSFDSEVADRGNARAMQVAALAQNDTWAKRFIYIYASVLTLVTLIYVFCITFCQIPQANVRFADTILGFLLGTVLSSIVFYFFGTSRTSAVKDEFKTELIHKLTTKE